MVHTITQRRDGLYRDSLTGFSVPTLELEDAERSRNFAVSKQWAKWAILLVCEILKLNFVAIPLTFQTVVLPFQETRWAGDYTGEINFSYRGYDGI